MQILPTIQEENDWVMYSSEKLLFNQLSSEQTIYCEVLHTVWYISGESLKEKIEVDHSWEWKGYEYCVAVFLHSFNYQLNPSGVLVFLAVDKRTMLSSILSKKMVTTSFKLFQLCNCIL